MSASLQITLNIGDTHRTSAIEIFTSLKQSFLDAVPGAVAMDVLVRPEDMQILHGFESSNQAAEYLAGTFFSDQVMTQLKPLLKAKPEIRVYQLIKG